MAKKLRDIGLVLNIIATFQSATADELRAGLSWYATMGDLVIRRMRLANRSHKCGYKLTRSVCLGIVAALSPNKSWVVNLDMCERLIISRRAGTYATQVAKALAILDGEDPLDALRGPKERSFYRCFMCPAASDDVTVDGHTLNIWLGEYMSTEKTKVSPRQYRLCKHDFQVAAEMLGVLPSQLQATCWIVWRRLNKSTGHTQDKNRGW